MGVVSIVNDLHDLADIQRAELDRTMLAITILTGAATVAVPVGATPIVTSFDATETVAITSAGPTATVETVITPTAARAPKYDYEQVARIASAAYDAGGSAQGALIAELGVSKPTASWLIKEARKRGLDCGRASTGGRKLKSDMTVAEIAAETQAKEAKATEPTHSNAIGLHLACDEHDCDFTADIDGGMKMLQHTLSEHGRTARKSEKTPRR